MPEITEQISPNTTEMAVEMPAIFYDIGDNLHLLVRKV